MSASKIYERCRHFTGIQHKACALGIVYDSVRDASGGRNPCLTLIGTEPATMRCPHRSLLTQEEFAAQDAALMAAGEKLVASLEAGRCPSCGASIEPSTIVGRCRYASCGHRVGQTTERAPPRSPPPVTRGREVASLVGHLPLKPPGRA